MLTITVCIPEKYDEDKQEFVASREIVLQLEHSLVSLSKWESKWRKSFLKKEEKTTEQALDYIRCMTITQNIDPKIYNKLTEKNIADIKEYIDAPMTATAFAKTDKTINRETITSELIYYWMISLNIPFDCQKWHLNRLLTLINVCNIKNQPPKKMSKSELMSRNAAINEARKKALNTRG